MQKSSHDQKGFTIIELLIATSVFSVILLIVTTGIIQLGRNYYKGITSARTQEAVRVIEDDITRTIQVSGVTNIEKGITVSHDGNDMQSLCVGNTRYSYSLNRQLGPASGNNLKHVLWTDQVLPNAGCPPLDLREENPKDFGGTSSIDPAGAKNQREMMITNARLTEFDITQQGNGLYKVDVAVTYGHDDVIEGGNCVSSLIGGQFCAKADLHTFVKRRL